MSNTNKRTRRSPSELLAAQQEKLNRLAQRAAAEQHAQHGAILAFDEAIESTNKDIIQSQRVFSKGPQNIAARRLAHELWISEINAQERVAVETLRVAQARKDELVKARKDALDSLVRGITIDPDVVRAAINVHGTDPILAAALEDLESAKKHRAANKIKADNENGGEAPEMLASI